MANGETVAIWGATVAGSLLLFLQTITLFILKDFRERIMRVESLLMKKGGSGG